MISLDCKRLLVIASCGLLAGTAGLSCGKAGSFDDSKLQFALPSTANTPPAGAFTSGKVSVENVSFTFDRKMIDRVEVSESAAEKLLDENTKPDGIGARMLNFDLRYASSDNRALVSVFKLADYKEAFGRFPHYLEQRDEDLNRLLSKPTSVKSWGIEEPIHVRWMDAHHDFYAKAQVVKFKGGRGLLLLTQIGQDIYNIINNEQLQFFFQGVSDDGIYFVEMSFPAKLDGLPSEASSKWFRYYNVPEDLSDPKGPDQYRSYVNRLAKEIDGASDDRVRPSTDQMRGFLASFCVESR